MPTETRVYSNGLDHRGEQRDPLVPLMHDDSVPPDNGVMDASPSIVAAVQSAIDDEDSGRVLPPQRSIEIQSRTDRLDDILSRALESCVDQLFHIRPIIVAAMEAGLATAQQRASLQKLHYELGFCLQSIEYLSGRHFEPPITGRNGELITAGRPSVLLADMPADQQDRMKLMWKLLGRPLRRQS